jgi:hypothetical protein
VKNFLLDRSGVGGVIIGLGFKNFSFFQKYKIKNYLLKMPYLWVKYGESQSVKVSTDNCQDIGDFIKAVKADFSPRLDAFPPSEIYLYISPDDGTALEVDAPLPIQSNTARTPLYIIVKPVKMPDKSGIFYLLIYFIGQITQGRPVVKIPGTYF